MSTETQQSQSRKTPVIFALAALAVVVTAVVIVKMTAEKPVVAEAQDESAKVIGESVTLTDADGKASRS